MSRNQLPLGADLKKHLALRTQAASADPMMADGGYAAAFCAPKGLEFQRQALSLPWAR
jgi:hypothetical protein